MVVNWFGNCVVDNGGGGSYVLPVASQDTLGGVKIGSGLTMSGDTLNANPGGYTLPIASENVLGGVKIGSGITIDSGGTISAQGGGTQYTAGNGIDLSGSTISVKIGDGLAFSGDTLVVSGGTDSNDYFVSWSGLYEMDYPERRAVFNELVDKYNAGYHIYASGTTAASNGYNVILPLVEFTPGTWSTDRYNGGWAKFGGIHQSGDTKGYFYASLGSTGNITPSSKYFSKSDFYTLPTAATNTKGGVKVGSGLTMSGETMSVNIGEGLAFSGNTIVATGGGGNTPRVIFLNKLTEQERIALYNELASKYDNNAQSWTTAFTQDDYAFFIDLRDYNDQAAYSVNDQYEGFFPMQVCRMHPTDFGNGAAFFSGIAGHRSGNGIIINILFVITPDGQDEHGTWWNNPGANPEYKFDLDITSAGTIAWDANWEAVADGSKWTRLAMRYYYDTGYQGWQAFSTAPVKWVYNYITEVNSEVKWYYILTADIPINGTVYTGVWGVHHDHWYGNGDPLCPKLISWTSGSTITDPSYPPYVPNV